MRAVLLWGLMLVVACACRSADAAEVPADPTIPAALAPWREWVLRDVQHLGAPSPYDDASERIAIWPSRLALDLTPSGGRWTLGVEAFDRTWVPLPGNAESWPQQVMLDGVPVAVLSRDGVPAVRVEAGLHRLVGEIAWGRFPEQLAVPPGIGIVELIRDGVPVPFPERDADGGLWLDRRPAAEQEQDQLSKLVSRVLEDGLPMWLRTEIELSVSGRSREEVIGQILPTGWQLAAITGQIPVAVDESGQLRAQVRPGTWQIRIDAFRTTDTTELSFPDETTPVTPEELIGLQVRPDFRVIEFTDAAPLDVAMTRFPERWRSLPLFQWETGKPLAWKVKDSGTGLRKPDRFEIHRRLWLDDDGAALTYEDTIVGECRALSRLDVVAGNELAVVRIDGQRQLITTDPESGAAGIELRSPRPVIEAIGRMQRDTSLSATGWQADPDRLQVTLALPPGWRMLALFGADHVDGDWLTAWTLLDLFLLLVFSLAVFRMRGVGAGLVAFFAFGLAYHELYAPRFTWLFVLAPVALLSVVRSKRATWWMQAWKLLAFGMLLMHLIPYVTGEVQSALYPQLEPGGIHYRQRDLWEIFNGPRQVTPPGEVQLDAALSASSVAASVSREPASRQTGAQSELQAERFQSANLTLAPGTSTQTGIPRPAWQGNLVECSWDGPVGRDQTLTPVILTAFGHRVLAVVRVLLLAVLLGIVARPSRANRRPLSGGGSGAMVASAVVLGVGLLAGAEVSAQEPADAVPARAADAGQEGPSTAWQSLTSDVLPSAALLDTLRQQLLKPDDAFPHAAEIAEARLAIAGNRLSLQATVHAAVACAVPLPGQLPVWSPLTVTRDGAAASVVRRADGHLWVWVPEGVCTLNVAGLIPESPEWILDFELTPRRLAVQAEAWEVTGVNANGRPSDQLFFTRRQPQEAMQTAYDQTNVRGVVQIDRVLEVGLVWKLQTTVRRLSEPGRAISLTVPLLPGERVLSGETTGAAGTVDVTLPPNVDATGWESELPVTEEIRLVAAENEQSVERWSLVTSPVWNVALAGELPVYEAGASELVPVWYPWPGETVVLAFERPKAVAGKSLTVRGIGRTIDVSARRQTSSIDLRVESSLGGEFFVGLPEKATVRSVELDGRSLPVRREAGRVLVGLKPGQQQLTVEWTTDEPLAQRATFDPVELPVEAANVASQMKLSEARWILWTSGPLRGPAVRFWAVLVLACGLAAMLSRPSLSPLRFHEWLLLLVGLTQISLVPAVAVVGWLYLLAWRGKRDPQAGGWLSFNMMQLVIVLLTIMSLVTLVVVVSRGLLGTPEMFISGNGSYGNRLVWFSPAEGVSLGQPWAFSVSIWYYRLLMLLWGLWLANAVIRWLIAGWRQFTEGGAWRWKAKIARPVG
jgi:hypothetical protein